MTAKNANDPLEDGGDVGDAGVTWSTKDIDFDPVDGKLVILNVELARKIEDQRKNTLRGRQLYMKRVKFPEEIEAERAALRREATTAPPDEPGRPIEGPKSNMLCPCEPTP